MRLHIYTYIHIDCIFSWMKHSKLSILVCFRMQENAGNRMAFPLSASLLPTLSLFCCDWCAIHTSDVMHLHLHVNSVLNCNWSALLVICSIYIHSSKYCDLANETIRFGSIGQSNAIHFIANACASHRHRHTYILFLCLSICGHSIASS